VDNADLLLVDGLRVLEGETEDTLGSFAGDELDALHDTVDDNVLNTGVFTLGVLTDENSVDVVVGGLVASNGAARTQVGEQVESTAESQVQGDVTLANGGLEKRSLVSQSRCETYMGNFKLEHTARGPLRAT
jgi:hypothetical protein